MTNESQALDDYLKEACILNFSASEVLRMRRLGVTVPVPDRDLWPNIIPTLQLAEEIRERLGHPLVVGNGYRPEPYNSRAGGTKRSQHVSFRALDLDLPSGYKTREHQEEFYRVACELYLSKGKELKMGLGLYRPWAGTRVHIDTGHRQRYWKRKFVKPLLDSLK